MGFVPFLILLVFVSATELFFENNPKIVTMEELKAVVSPAYREHPCFNYDIPDGFDTCLQEADRLFEDEVPNINDAFPLAYSAAFLHFTTDFSRKNHAIHLALTLATLIRYDATADALLSKINDTSFHEKAAKELNKRIQSEVKQSYWAELPYRALVSPKAKPKSLESIAFHTLTLFSRKDLLNSAQHHVSLPITQVYSAMMAYSARWNAPLVDSSDLPPSNFSQACRESVNLSLASPGYDFFASYGKYPIDQYHEPVLLNLIDTSLKKRENRIAEDQMKEEVAEASVDAEKRGGRGDLDSVFTTAMNVMRRGDSKRAGAMLESNARMGHILSLYQLAANKYMTMDENEWKLGLEYENELYDRGVSAHALTAFRYISAIFVERDYEKAFQELEKSDEEERKLAFWTRLNFYYISGRLPMPTSTNKTADLLEAFQMQSQLTAISSADMLSYIRMGENISRQTMDELYFHPRARLTPGQREWLSIRGMDYLDRYNLTVDDYPVDICEVAIDAEMIPLHIMRGTILTAEKVYHERLYGLAFALYAEAAVYGIPIAYVNAGDLLLEHPESSGLRHPEMVAAIFHAIAASSHDNTALFRLASLPLQPTQTQPNVEELMVTSVIGTSLDYIDHKDVNDPRIQTTVLITQQDIDDMTNEGRRFRILLHAASRGNADAVLQCVRTLFSRAKMFGKSPEYAEQRMADVERAHEILKAYIRIQGNTFESVALVMIYHWLKNPGRIIAIGVGAVLILIINSILVHVAERNAGPEEELPENIRDIIHPGERYTDDPEAMAQAMQLSIQTAREEEERRARGELPRTYERDEPAADAATNQTR